MKRFIMLALLVGFFSAGLAFTQTATPRIERRQAEQQARINQGVRSGELTPEEARGLRAEQRLVRITKRAMRADGVVTPRERRVLNRQLNRTSRDISREKDDSEKR
jgi:hypothetical protein